MSKLKKFIFLLSFVSLFLLISSIKSDAYCWPIANSNGTIDYTSTYIEYGYGKRVYTVDKNLWSNEGSYSKTENHHGVDITGTPNSTYRIVSVSGGTVIATSANRASSAGTSFANNNQRQGGSYKDGGGYGNYVLIKDNSSNFVFLYAHLAPNSLTVKKGDSVAQGQVIGTMGSSGDAGHMHLHFEIRRNISSALANPSASRSNMKTTSLFDYESSLSVSINPVKYIYTKQMATDYVTSLYKNILGRNPDTSSLNTWVKALMTGTSQAQILSSFYNSQEFTGKNYDNSTYVEKLYAGCLQRGSDSSGKSKYVNMLNSGHSRSEVLSNFTKSSEFQNLCTKYYAIDFVSSAYTNILGRNIDSTGRKSWSNYISTTNNPANVLYSLYNSTEFTNKNYSNSDYINKLYVGCLQRNCDANGKTTYTNYLNSGKSRTDLLKTLMNSTEYRRLVAKNYGLSNINI